jgi:hypothetical protein
MLAVILNLIGIAPYRKSVHTLTVLGRFPYRFARTNQSKNLLNPKSRTYVFLSKARVFQLTKPVSNNQFKVKK